VLHGERKVILRQILAAVMPFYCVLCGEATEKNKALCKGCELDLPWLKKGCSICSVPLTVDADRCGACQHKPPAFDHVHTLFHYQRPVDNLITGLKFNDRLANARLLGGLLAEKLQTMKIDPPDALLPVPLHPQRLRERGFNQALELARPLAKAWHSPLLTRAVVRTRDTQAQMELPAKQRHSNIRGAFECTGRLTGKRIAIVDDVVTTGSTVNELARVLKHNGVERVEVFSIARAG